MAKPQKLLEKILRGGADANISFKDLCNLLIHLGFEERVRSSHHMFRKEGIAEKINLQQDGSKAKAYQVRQVRDVIVRHGLAGEEHA